MDKKNKVCRIIVYSLFNSSKLYNAYCDYEIAEVASDNSYLTLDSDPYDIGDPDGYEETLAWLYYNDLFETAVESIHKAIGLPESLLLEIYHTSPSDGRQTRSYYDKGFSVSWRYSIYYGVDVIYKLI